MWFSVRCIEEIFKVQRTLCDLFRPSLKLLLVETGRGELECADRITNKTSNVKPHLRVKNGGSARHTVNAASAQLAKRQLKQLTSVFCVCEY